MFARIRIVRPNCCREMALVGQNRRSVGTARLAEVGHHVVNAHRDVAAYPSVRLVRQGVLDRLDVADRSGELGAARRIALHQAHAEKRLHAIERVVVGLVAADLRVQVAAEAAVNHAASPPS